MTAKLELIYRVVDDESDEMEIKTSTGRCASAYQEQEAEAVASFERMMTAIYGVGKMTTKEDEFAALMITLVSWMSLMCKRRGISFEDMVACGEVAIIENADKINDFFHGGSENDD